MDPVISFLSTRSFWTCKKLIIFLKAQPSSFLAFCTKTVQRSSILVPSILIKEKNLSSLVVYLSRVTGEFIAYLKIEYGSGYLASSRTCSVVNSFCFHHIICKTHQKGVISQWAQGSWTQHIKGFIARVFSFIYLFVIY